ncbi:3-oxoacid CoA-transferase subunit B [Pseudoroseomonas cervicalis]|uniref:3-oxoacid CoA-transferase subunit B n=1 Tax=Teichococcus cervicalis TaxID=204525 RepID=UPI00278AD730|nr:3-oxoacid CoA-transferase subunit B [Pseudoroseomonas cervicalis]MDQ1077733.1 3-oxoadipate CoA-transferase beta subunit [Pseudoroseomonas cervicalis]
MTPNSLPLSREQIARRVARAMPDGAFVNLGIGLPDSVPDHIPDGIEIFLHSENGVLHIGPRPPQGEEDWDLINAGKQPVTLRTGGSYFDSSLSFAMMRGGHLDISVLGAFQVSERGDLANWSTGAGDGIPAVGGAMDLAVGARQIWVMMEHNARDGAPRILRECHYPLTARGVVKRVFTNLALLAVTEAGLLVEEILPGLSFEELQARTEARLIPGAMQPLLG